MKNQILTRIGLILLLGIGMTGFQSADASPPVAVNFQVFYNELSPYGDWIMDPTHGYVWIPNAGRNFHPYATNGYWTMTNYGNTWVSDYAWGWAPFHYGRWFWSDFYGWAWVPGYEWGPAWVSWRSGGGYYGWAPLSPGIGIHLSVQLPRAHWIFIPQRRFRHRNFHRYYVPSYQVVNIYNRTTVINNTYVYNNNTYIAGPNRREIERVTSSRVPVYQVNNSSRPGRAAINNNNLNIYRPQIARNQNGRSVARPEKAYTVEEYRSRASNPARTPAATPARNTNGNNNRGITNGNNSNRAQGNNPTTVNSPQRSQNSNAARSRTEGPDVNNNSRNQGQHSKATAPTRVQSAPAQRNQGQSPANIRNAPKNTETVSPSKQQIPNSNRSNTAVQPSRNATKTAAPSSGRTQRVASPPNRGSSQVKTNSSSKSNVGTSSRAPAPRSQSTSRTTKSGRGNN